MALGCRSKDAAGALHRLGFDAPLAEPQAPGASPPENTSRLKLLPGWPPVREACACDGALKTASASAAGILTCVLVGPRRTCPAKRQMAWGGSELNLSPRAASRSSACQPQASLKAIPPTIGSPAETLHPPARGRRPPLIPPSVRPASKQATHTRGRGAAASSQPDRLEPDRLGQRRPPRFFLLWGRGEYSYQPRLEERRRQRKFAT